jgi:hypothetical protein
VVIKKSCFVFSDKQHQPKLIIGIPTRVVIVTSQTNVNSILCSLFTKCQGVNLRSYIVQSCICDKKNLQGSGIENKQLVG